MIRWLLWNLVCWRGLRCADGMLSGDLDEENHEVLAASTVILTYRCGGCGTEYSRGALIGNDGVYTHSDRVRVG